MDRFIREVLRAALVELTSKALIYVSIGLLASFALLVVFGGSVPAWLLAVALLSALAVLAACRYRARGIEREIRDRDGAFSSALERFEVYTAHVAEVLDHLQRVLSGNIDVKIPVYIERGILEPARDLLANDGGEYVRLSVLLPYDENFIMVWAAGHTLPGQSGYRVPIKDTLSRVAYESGEPQAWDDVTEDDRFEQNPKASNPTRSMVSIPLRHGEHVIGVLNAIASQPSVFDPAEERYLASLGSVISVAVSIFFEREGGRAP